MNKFGLEIQKFRTFNINFKHHITGSEIYATKTTKSTGYGGDVKKNMHLNYTVLIANSFDLINDMENAKQFHLHRKN